MAISITHGKRDRPNFKGAIYHITSRCNNRAHSFMNKADFQKYIAVIEQCKDKYDFVLHDYAAMNSHSHLILRLEGVINISCIMHSINRRYAAWHNKEYGRTGHFWEERFYGELIADDLQLLTTMIYIHLNPVKARLCGHPAEWKFSGARYYLKGDIDPLITPPDVYKSLGTTPETRREIYAKILEPYHARLNHEDITEEIASKKP